MGDGQQASPQSPARSCRSATAGALECPALLPLSVLPGRLREPERKERGECDNRYHQHGLLIGAAARLVMRPSFRLRLHQCVVLLSAIDQFEADTASAASRWRR